MSTEPQLEHTTTSTEATLRVTIPAENPRKGIDPIVFGEVEARAVMEAQYGDRLGKLVKACTLENREGISRLTGVFVYTLQPKKARVVKPPATKKTTSSRRRRSTTKTTEE